MKTILLLVLSLGLSQICFAAPQNKGVIREYDMHNRLRAEYSYKNGRLDGVCKEYYGNGRLASKRTFKDGKRDGLSRLYYETGKLQLESIYKAGRYVSSREFNEQGRALNGEVKEYYPEGQLLSESNYDNGVLEGPAKVYYEDGTLRSQAIYQQGVLVSEKEYDVLGKLINEENYESSE